MGTRINALLDCEFGSPVNGDSVLAQLTAALPAALLVQDYWRAADPASQHEELHGWRTEPVSPRRPGLSRYTGPGSLFLSLTARTAHVRTGGRWRGFLTIDTLRHVHLAAFRQIATALGTERLAIYADSCEVDDLFWGGRTMLECVELMVRLWGPPQPTVDEIASQVSRAAEQTVPEVWFLTGAEGSPSKVVADRGGC
jgi:hypothetical protein